MVLAVAVSCAHELVNMCVAHRCDEVVCASVVCVALLSCVGVVCVALWRACLGCCVGLCSLQGRGRQPLLAQPLPRTAAHTHTHIRCHGCRRWRWGAGGVWRKQNKIKN